MVQEKQNYNLESDLIILSELLPSQAAQRTVAMEAKVSLQVVSPLLPHNSDLRDSHEYLQKQVWGAQNCTRKNSRRFGVERIRLTKASVAVCFDSAHPTYLETICVLSYVAQI